MAGLHPRNLCDSAGPCPNSPPSIFAELIKVNGNQTVVVGLDDSKPGKVYFYAGIKASAGSAVEKAGLASGSLHSLQITGTGS